MDKLPHHAAGASYRARLRRRGTTTRIARRGIGSSVRLGGHRWWVKRTRRGGHATGPWRFAGIGSRVVLRVGATRRGRRHHPLAAQAELPWLWLGSAAGWTLRAVSTPFAAAAYRPPCQGRTRPASPHLRPAGSPKAAARPISCAWPAGVPGDARPLRRLSRRPAPTKRIGASHPEIDPGWQRGVRQP
jgi:hypothetical protein